MAPQFYKWQSRKRLKPSQSLPTLPGIKNEKEFGKKKGITKGLHRQYLNARAQYAGYASYSAWQKARRETGVEKKNLARAGKSKTLATANNVKAGKLYVFNNLTKAGKLSETKMMKNIQLLTELINRADDRKFAQVYAKTNTYGLEDRPPTDWDFTSSGLYAVNGLKEDIEIFGTLGFIEEFSHSRPYTFKRGGKYITLPGISEIQIVFWNKLAAKK